MKLKILLLIIPLFFCGSIFGQTTDSVKFILKGNKYWNNVNLNTRDDYVDYWKQINIGEVIDVLDGDCQLGKLDVPPKIICIMVIGMTRDKALGYLVPVVSELSDTIMIKERKTYFNKSVIDSAIVLWNENKSYLRISKKQFDLWVNTYTEADINFRITNEITR